ncbi:unnamed protein product [Adineta ricciae]|uniref:Uncharacterized protein n=1 Tax=Adineta ricciae TaxID=249248 RepID=A0A815U5A9_ADIRI|nr:unnamed protein product [Adineta ricciae]CAF1509421.1 unnamed protein product [Adineta ricciae]
MATNVVFNNDQQMYVPVSMVAPISTIVIQIPVPQMQYVNHSNTVCMHCGRNNQSDSTDEKEKEKTTDDVIFIEEKHSATNDVIFVKEEKSDVPELLNNIQNEEYIMNLDVDERNCQQNTNQWSNVYSPISFNEPFNVERSEVPFSQTHDAFFDTLFRTCYDDIGELVEYLKEDM